jgi:DNA-binding MarR family transcriptional regulator
VALAPHDLTASQFSTLVAASLGGGMPLGQLADRLGTDRTTLTRVLAPLERRGLVGSGGAKGDARSRIVSLTEAGRLLLAAAIPAWDAAQAEALRKIGADGWPDMRTRLARLSQE